MIDFKKLLSPLILLVPLFLLVPLTFGQQTELTNVFDIADQDAKDGDILVFEPGRGILRTTTPYDVRLFGVLQASPSAVYKRIDGSGTPVVKGGIANINVTTINGPITAGDHITSSEIAGLGMKADLSGQSVGVALENFTETDGTSLNQNGRNVRTGKIAVAIKIEFAELTTPRSINSFFAFFGTSLLSNIQDPAGFGQVIRYIFAGLIVLIAIIFSMIILTRSIPKAIESIGRNPLARSAITLSIGLNIAIVLVVTFGAIIAAFIIIKL